LETGVSKDFMWASPREVRISATIIGMPIRYMKRSILKRRDPMSAPKRIR
jgi:hypothetical protein